MKKSFGAVFPLCGLLLGCSIENLDLSPDSKNQESSLDAEAKTTYNLKIASEEVSRYAGQTCFMEATSVNRSPDKIVAERLLTTAHDSKDFCCRPQNHRTHAASEKRLKG